MRIGYKTYALLFCLLTVLSSKAQTQLSARPDSGMTIRNISVSQEQSYTDHLSLAGDATDMDIMVKFVFDEAANQLTVSLISHRMLFVFREDARYKPLIKGRKLRPDQLPYVVNTDPADQFKISSVFKRTIPKPRKKHIFYRWVEYDGLQPAPQEYMMVNDYISQTFDIQKKHAPVIVRLRDILLMNDISKRLDKRIYEISFVRDLATEYRIDIKRNPCFGLDEEVVSAQAALEGISKSYTKLYKKYGKGTVADEENLSVFNDLKETLVKQYPHQDAQSPCPDIQQARDAYNAYVDSIASMECKVVASNAGGKGIGSAGVSPKLLLSKARQIDTSVARWLLSTDPIERRDIITNVENIIKTTNETVASEGVWTPEQKQALSVFREAERYFKNNCQK